MLIFIDAEISMPTNTELVQQLYGAYFNRPADVAGLTYYVGLLDKASDVVAMLVLISADFSSSSESIHLR
jgi:hypothetical protein